MVGEEVDACGGCFSPRNLGLFPLATLSSDALPRHNQLMRRNTATNRLLLFQTRDRRSQSPLRSERGLLLEISAWKMCVSTEIDKLGRFPDNYVPLIR